MKFVVLAGLIGSKKFKILSLDGGGVRGIATSIILQEIEKEAGKPISQLFDLIVGTSTGALLGGLLNLPKNRTTKEPKFSAKEVTQKYLELSPKIFTKTYVYLDYYYLFNNKYTNIDKHEAISTIVGNLTLSDLLVNMVIPAYDVAQDSPYFFKTSKAKKENKYNYKLSEVFDSTTSAPTYFGPIKVEGYDSPQNGYRSFVDGGIVANNPEFVGVSEALKKNNKSLDDILILSLGTGKSVYPNKHEDVLGWNSGNRLVNLITMLFQSSMTTSRYFSEAILNDDQHLRIDFDINDNKRAEFDNIAPENLQWLIKKGNESVHENKEKLKNFTKLLLDNI